MTFYQWFAKNGDKVFALVTVMLGAMTVDYKQLGLSETFMHWALLSGTVATAAHTLFFPNAVMPPNNK